MLTAAFPHQNQDRIYLIRAKGTNYVKIGFTAVSGAMRLKSLQTGNPEELEVIGEYRMSESRAVEDCLHSLLQPYCTNGEWFWLSEDLVACCKRLLGMMGTPCPQSQLPREEKLDITPVSAPADSLFPPLFPRPAVWANHRDPARHRELQLAGLAWLSATTGASLAEIREWESFLFKEHKADLLYRSLGNRKPLVRARITELMGESPSSAP